MLYLDVVVIQPKTSQTYEQDTAQESSLLCRYPCTLPGRFSKSYMSKTQFCNVKGAFNSLRIARLDGNDRNLNRNILLWSKRYVDEQV